MAGRYNGYGKIKEKEGTTPVEGHAFGSRQRGRPTSQETAIRNELMNIFLDGMNVQVSNAIHEAVQIGAADAVKDINEKIERLENHRVIQLQTPKAMKVLEDQTHHTFPELVRALTTGIPVMLVGPAGTGKTYAALQVSRLLEIPFYSISVGVQTSKSDIGGYMNAVGGYVRSQFRDAYENGGVFLMDEIDAGNSNVLIFINAALSSDYCAFPDGMVKKHEDFRFIGTGNTYGTGASRQYVGRNQLDAATIDRFIVLDWPIDKKLEESFVKHLKFGSRWLRVIEEVREVIEKSEARLIVSPRATMKGALLLEAGADFKQALESSVLSQATKDQRKIITDAAERTWGR